MSSAVAAVRQSVTPPDDDPKRLVHLHVALDRAVAEWSAGRGVEAVDTLRAVIRERAGF